MTQILLPSGTQLIASWVGPGECLGVLEIISCPYQDLNPISSSLQLSHYSDYAIHKHKQATDFLKADSELQTNGMMVNIIVIQEPASMSTQDFPSVWFPSQVKHTHKVHMHNPWQ